MSSCHLASQSSHGQALDRFSFSAILEPLLVSLCWLNFLSCNIGLNSDLPSSTSPEDWLMRQEEEASIFGILPQFFFFFLRWSTSGWPQTSNASASWMLRSQAWATIPAICKFWEWNLGLFVCKASTLPTELQHQPWVQFKNIDTLFLFVLRENLGKSILSFYLCLCLGDPTLVCQTL